MSNVHNLSDYKHRVGNADVIRADQKAEDNAARGVNPHVSGMAPSGAFDALMSAKDVSHYGTPEVELLRTMLERRVVDAVRPIYSPSARRMLRDVMITAFEGGSTYWAEARNVIREKGCPEVDYISFEVRSFEDRDDPRLGGWQRVDEDVIAQGMRRILDAPQDIGEFGVSPLRVRRDILASIAIADRRPEDADIDAEVADCILQAGIWGEIVYG